MQDRQKGAKNVIWNLLFSAQMQPIYACCSCCPRCYVMLSYATHKPKTIGYSTDLVQLYSYLTITTFSKLWNFLIKIIYLITSSSSGLHSMFLGKTALWHLHIKASWHFKPNKAPPKPRNFYLCYQSREHSTSESKLLTYFRFHFLQHTHQLLLCVWVYYVLLLPY
jgi:hypothetical protein